MTKEFSLVKCSYKSNKGLKHHNIICFKVGRIKWTNYLIVCVTHTDYFNPVFKADRHGIKVLCAFNSNLYERCLSLKNRHRKYIFARINERSFEEGKRHYKIWKAHQI